MGAEPQEAHLAAQHTHFNTNVNRRGDNEQQTRSQCFFLNAASLLLSGAQRLDFQRRSLTITMKVIFHLPALFPVEILII